MKGNLVTSFDEMKKRSGLILLCLIIGFFAWQAIRKNIGFEILVSDIVVDVKVPENWAVWEKSVGKVNILFRGSRENIRYLNNDQLRVVVDMNNPSEGDVVRVKLTDKFLKSPTDVRVVNFQPSEISIKLDRETQKVLPVKAAIEGSPPEGLDVERIICVPATVPVTGAKRLLDKMEHIYTERINFNNRRSSFEENVPVELPESGKLSAPAEWIKVSCTLAERSDMKQFKNVPVRVMLDSGDNRNITIQPDKVDLTVKGLSQRLDSIRSEDLFGYISGMDLVESTGYDLPAKMNIPDDLKIVEVNPPVVHVNISNGKR